jgi:hypothetical protein
MFDLPLGVWGLLLLASVWINLIVLMRFTCKNLHIIEHHLSDCQGVINTRNLWGGGVIGRHMRLSIIFAGMWMPRIMHRRGDFTKDAHLNIPRRLRWRIWAVMVWLIINCMSMAVLYFAIKASK